MRAKFFAAIGLCLSFTAEARAQALTSADDTAYCAQLSALYRRYIGDTGSSRIIPDVAAATAMDQCERGNTAAGTPVLERKLLAARFTLPARL